MITKEDYTILDIPNKTFDLGNNKLCIINFDIIKNFDYLKKLINSNKTVTYWAATTDFSKRYIQAASVLGISNVVQFPIKTDVIDSFFYNQKTEVIKNDVIDYQPLTDSKIMIVDDNIQNISLLEEVLADMGVEITSCSTPSEALDILKDTKFDLFLLDILMPQMSGFELAEIIKETDLNNNSKIIFISAISGDMNMMNGYNLGATLYIEKPFSPQLVKAQIYNLLKHEEQAKEISKSKDNFVATLTHDLKNPINSEILAIKQLLRNPNYNSEILPELLNSANYLKHITDQILSHYKQKNGLYLRKENTDLNKLLLSSIEEVKYLFCEKNIKIRYYNELKTSDITVDPIEIKRLFVNLLSNAIEYSYSDSFIDLIAETVSKYYKITVKDYGVGIDLKNHTKIFDDYVTLSKKYKKVGFGLGLSISKTIVKAHGGDIDIVSEPNKGTSVIVLLPIE